MEYIGIAIKGVVMWPIGITEPKYPAADPWFSGLCANDNDDARAGLIIPNPNPKTIIDK